LKAQVQEAEKKLKSAEKELESKDAKTFLQESQIVELRKEKEKLEQKLIRYIEKVIKDDEARRARERRAVKKGEVVDLGETPLKKARAATKQELARQKLNMHYNLALAYDRQGLYREEEKEYLECLWINPDDANVHYNLGILYDDKLNNNEKAIEHYKRYLQLRPSGDDTARVKTWMLHAEQEQRLGPEMR